MHAYDDLNVYYGDLHNHCDISYGHGSLDDAFRNAREQLDVCSVTGHALWPDMPAPSPVNRHIIDFHHEGFARLRARWDAVRRTTAAYHREGEFVTFLSFEMHGCADGDRTVLYNGAEGEILPATGLADLHDRLRDLRAQGVEVMAFPHHIGYRQGQRGINWATFDPALAPVVEVVSMHGGSEADEGPRPFLHTMGPSDHGSTMQAGLAQGHVFGVIGSTDHHSAHPGSYGHGRTGFWAGALTRDAIWSALQARRTYALTGDRIRVTFTLNDRPMGAVAPPADRRRIAFHVVGGAPIDAVDVVKNNALLRRFSRCDVSRDGDSMVGAPVHTKLLLEVGWGPRGVRQDWDVRFTLSAGRLLAVEPRFRGPEVVTPVDVAADALASALAGAHDSHWEPAGPLGVAFRTVTFGNPTTTTAATQGVCLEVEAPLDAEIRAVINGQRVVHPLRRLLDGARAGRLGPIGTASYRFHRAPRWWELDWRGSLEDQGEAAAPAGTPAWPAERDVYYLRVRQVNGQWAWSSPIWI
jgi:hypothetical protein